MRTTLAAMLAALALVPVLALAGQSIPRFGEIDSNSDGLIDRQEFQAAFPDAGPRAYEVIAGEKDAIGPEEWSDFRGLHEKGERLHGPGFHDEGSKTMERGTGTPRSMDGTGLLLGRFARALCLFRLFGGG